VCAYSIKIFHVVVILMDVMGATHGAFNCYFSISSKMLPWESVLK
jgi:hypothetical protein